MLLTLDTVSIPSAVLCFLCGVLSCCLFLVLCLHPTMSLCILVTSLKKSLEQLRRGRMLQRGSMELQSFCVWCASFTLSALKEELAESTKDSKQKG